MKMKLKIGTKLIAGFMVLVTLMLVISLVAYFNLQTVAKSADVILDDEVPIADASMEAMIAVISGRDIMGEYLLQTDLSKLDEIRKEYDEVVTDFDMYLNAMMYGSESKEFETAEGGKIHEMWVKDGLDNEMVIKKANDEVIRLAKEADEFHEKFSENAEEMMKHHKLSLQAKKVELNQDDIEAREHMAELDKWSEKADQKMDEVEVAAKKSMNAAMVAGDKAVAQANLMIIIISVISIALGLLIGILLSRSISRPVVAMAEAAEAISQGDLDQKIDIKSTDEIGDMANSFTRMIDYIKGIANVSEKVADGDLTEDVEPRSAKDILGTAFKKMINNLRNIVRNILESSDQVAASSEELSKTAQNLSEGSQKQAASLEESSSSMEEMTSSVEQISEKAQNQASSVEEVTSTIEELTSSIKGVYENAKKVREGADNSLTQADAAELSSSQAIEGMKKIEDSSNSIKNIISVINDIADQTNLLALNASVEAARAGDAGRGFAVVAQEISKLADRSAGATKEIADLIAETGTNVESGSKMVTELDESIKKMKEISQTASQFGQEMADATEEQLKGGQQVTEAVQNVNEMAQAIASSSEEQSSTTQETSKTIEGVNQITQQNASSAEEMASSTEELSSQAENMKQVIGQFRLSEENKIETQKQAGATAKATEETQTQAEAQ